MPVPPVRNSHVPAESTARSTQATTAKLEAPRGPAASALSAPERGPADAADALEPHWLTAIDAATD